MSLMSLTTCHLQIVIPKLLKPNYRRVQTGKEPGQLFSSELSISSFLVIIIEKL